MAEPQETIIEEMCPQCEGTGHDTCWHDDGSASFDPRYPCRSCDGRGYFSIPTEPLELEDLVPLVPTKEWWP